MTTRSEATLAAGPLDRRVRRLSEREIAIALLLEYAETNCISFSLMGFYDDDYDFLQGLAKRLSVPHDMAFKSKLRRVVQRLVSYGVLYASMRRTDKHYIDEPAKQRNYRLRTGKAELMRQPYRPGITFGSEGEAEHLLRDAYPRPEKPNASGKPTTEAAKPL